MIAPTADQLKAALETATDLWQLDEVYEALRCHSRGHNIMIETADTFQYKCLTCGAIRKPE